MLTLTPGSDWAFVISAGVRGRVAIPTIAGMIAGYAAIIGVVSVGLGAIVVANQIAMTGLTVVGSGYLMFMGLKAILSNGGPQLSQAGANGTWVSQFARGAGVTSINPNGIMLLLVLLPQFSSTHVAFPPMLQLLILGSLFLACIVVVYSGLAVFSRRVLGARPAATRIATKVSGTAMLITGGLMIAHRLLG